MRAQPASLDRAGTRPRWLRAQLDSLALPRASKAKRGVAQAIARHGQLTAATVSLALVEWAAEWSGGLPESTLRALLAVQLRLLCGGLLLDELLDGEAAPGATPWDAVRLFTDAQLRLGRIFSPRDVFWKGYARVMGEQCASARWEVRTRSVPPARADAALLQALGRKAALLRWPMFAVASLVKRPALSEKLDRLAVRLFGVLQALDDLLDAESDAASGQTNAVIVAERSLPARRRGAREAAPGIEVHLRRARAVAQVCALGRKELDRIDHDKPEGRGLAGCSAQLRGWLDTLEARAARTARLQISARICDALIEPTR